MSQQKVNDMVVHLFRREAGRMTAVLTRMLGFKNFQRAEDIVQDTLLTALSVWKIKGIPGNPSAWLHTVAKRKAIDILRQQKVRDGILSEIAESFKSEFTLIPAVNNMFVENEIEDSQLRMVFACCHPAIPYESQIALTLKHLCGLSIGEIAKKFLTSEETVTKRLFRAREKIRTENIQLNVPAGHELAERLDTVLHTLYLLFTEGYYSSHPEKIIRHDLTEEAIRLCLILTGNPVTNLPKTNALLALMCLQASRMDARLSDDGKIILLKDQDRSLWNKRLIEKGLMYLNRASVGEALSDYHIEAAIASCHALATSFEATNWKEIRFLYEALSAIKPGPVVEMNKAIAIGYSDSPDKGIELLLQVDGLNDFHIYHAALGDFYAAKGDSVHATSAYQKALSCVKSSTERELLTKKISVVAH